MTTVPRPAAELSADDARRIALRAQGFLGAPDRRAGVRGVLRSLGQVQLDTISVLARSHELIPYARLGAVGRTTVEDAYWTGTHAFEYWSHAACVLPVEEWPLFAFRRRAYRGRPHWGHELSPGAYDKVISQLRDEGPRTATELGGAKNKGEWWDWSDSKIAVERALMHGEVVVVERRGWKRVYDLAERAIPEALLHDDLDDTECVRRLVRQAGEALGVGTRADIADYHRLKGEQFDAAVEASGLVPVTVAGWGKPAWADPAALATEPRGRHRTTLLSPFDSLIWERARTERIFGFTHRLEAYVPKQKRIHGYFAMPVLSGGRLVGRVDPAREGRTLVARQVTLDGPKAVPAVARALREAAEWVGCDTVTVVPDRVNLPLLAPELIRELG
ncbi:MULTISPECIES: winged helix-turn-helix domain-containing protein [unclassified Streptomyces]|uniref:winged helix-turn-helix domain-containing protein n=1 Tax=unclassified Streptomyces TaxID=2593676 RepID=UPI0006AFB2E5|nr:MULTISPECIES: crosslink repair DNA glycosylase YcaQ family protein [unclassified Streptomyces]KOX37028.1 cytoplasmic protein [Streptomyces sp. NRRL F-6491]KOX51850.1 cytoplasmic protein [Streptomyces sp. NRRL F-6492]